VHPDLVAEQQVAERCVNSTEESAARLLSLRLGERIGLRYSERFCQRL
jgi:hypothetical protein